MTEDVESRENIESSASKKIKKSITIEFVKPENFRQIYAIGAAGGHSPMISGLVFIMTLQNC